MAYGGGDRGALVILIGGPPGAGKTTLGRALASRLGCAWLTVDDLAVAIRSVTTAESHPAFHHMPNGHAKYFTETAIDTLIADAEALEHAIWPAIDRLIAFKLANAESVVMDWWLLPPERVASLRSDQVRSLWLSIDEAELDRREWAGVSFRASSDDPELMHRNFMARSLWRNQLISAEARRLQLPLLHQPGGVGVDDLVAQALARLGRGDDAW